MKYLLIILLFAAVVLSLTKTTHTAKQPLQQNDTVLAVGDSLTYGFGAKADQSYPFLLSKKSGLTIINAGISGETSSEGLRRLPELLEQYHPKLTILCFGGNDILRKLSMQQLKNNLKSMIILAKKKGSDVLLIAIPTITLFGLDHPDLYEEVAEETGTSLLSGVLSEILEDPSLKSDYIHPNASGYKKMATKVYEHLVTEGWIGNYYSPIK